MKVKIMHCFPMSTAVVCVSLLELLGVVVRNKWASYEEVLGWLIIKGTSGEVSGEGKGVLGVGEYVLTVFFFFFFFFSEYCRN